MDRKFFLWVVIGILFLVALFLVFQVGASGNSVENVAIIAKSVASPSTMVGGC